MKEKYDIEKEGNVIDIRKEIMTRNVESDGVQFIPIGESGDNYVITLSKHALIAVREGKSFPIEVLAGGKKKTIILMRDNTFKRRMQVHNKLAEQAKEHVQGQLQVDAEMNALNETLAKNIIED